MPTAEVGRLRCAKKQEGDAPVRRRRQEKHVSVWFNWWENGATGPVGTRPRWKIVVSRGRR
jgi:hypothetical protein